MILEFLQQFLYKLSFSWFFLLGVCLLGVAYYFFVIRPKLLEYEKIQPWLNDLIPKIGKDIEAIHQFLSKQKFKK